MNEINNEEYIKEFDEWNIIKKSLDKRILPDSSFFLEREIWWTSIGINIRTEVDGKHEHFERPALILKKFNENEFMGLSISTKENIGGLFHTMIHGYELRFILLKQIRFYSVNRLLRLMMRIEETEFNIVKEKVRNILL